ncbi:hypothetical protein BD410DRAFT_104683 [Rickenella mellea]|uniref:Uncharacterized protein n=1 Tax=Rickenella mellea TaxID=50990 RepID=A0A4Y7PLU9_9AGAM|nr:hypothetical protein BD410DRAFT_104683 [Rickenella mellea]
MWEKERLAREARNSTLLPIVQDEGGEDDPDAPVADDSDHENESVMESTGDGTRGLNLDADMSPPSDIPLIDPREDATTIYAGSHEAWFVRAILMLVAFLHTRHHVSFRACNILLFCLNAIFLFLNLITIDAQMPVNLATVLKKLELGDRFVVYPICHLCHRIFRPDIPVASFCPDCDTALFKAASSCVFERIKRRPAPLHLPSAQRLFKSSLRCWWISSLNLAMKMPWRHGRHALMSRADIKISWTENYALELL